MKILSQTLLTALRTPTVLITIIVASGVAMWLGLVPMNNWSAWFDLFFGRVIHDFGAVPASNHAMYSMDVKAPSVLASWLAQRSMFGAYQVLDIEAVIWLRNHLYAIAFLLAGLAAHVRARGTTPQPTLFFAVMCCGVLSCVAWCLSGPQMFAAPLWATSLAIGAWVTTTPEPLSKKQLGAAAVALMVISTLWANLDISFGLSALTGVWIAAHEKQRGRQWPVWLGVSVLCAATWMINPRGPALYMHSVDILTTYMGHAQTLTWVHLLPTSGASGVLFWLIVAIGAVVLWLTPQRRLADVVLFVALALLGASHARATIWFGLALPIVLMAPRSRDEEHATQSTVGWSRVLIVLALANILPILTQPIFVTHALLANNVPGIARRGVQPHATTLPSTLPLEAVQMIKRQMSEGQRLYVDHRAAGYVLFELQPKQPYPMVQADERLELLDDKQWKQFKLIETSDIWRGLFQVWGVDFALLHKSRQPKLIEALTKHSKWNKGYEDTQWVYFAHN